MIFHITYTYIPETQDADVRGDRPYLRKARRRPRHRDCLHQGWLRR